MTFLYFAYGSNLLHERLRLDNPSATFISIAQLQNHTLQFSSLCRKPESLRWKGGAATITEHPGNCVWGCVWSLDNADMKSLDKQEGVYSAKQVEVIGVDNEIKYSCRTYQLPDLYLDNQVNDQRPSPMYMDVIIRGAKQNNLPKDYVDYLQSIENNGDTFKLEIYEHILSLLKD